MKPRRSIEVALLGLLVVGLGAQCTPRRAPEATVVYYYIPGCAVCARTSARLGELLAPYRDRVVLRRVDCTSEEGVAAVEHYRFRSHGLALLDRDGRAQLIESDHRVFPEHVVEALGRILPPAALARR